MPVGDLYRTFDDIIRYFHEGELIVRNVNDFGDKVIVVLQDKNVVSKSVEVIDATKHPDVDIITDGYNRIVGISCPPTEKFVTASTDDDEIFIKDGEVTTTGTGRTLCKYCGKSVTSRGATRHENKCTAKPLDSLYKARKVKRKK